MRKAFERLMTILCLLFLFTAHLDCFAEPVLMVGRIIRVVDGDTVVLQDERRDIYKIRLAGIDAPESRQSFGPEAKTFLRRLVLGKQVKTLAYKKDRYGRTIATIFLHEQDVNLAVIDVGLAWHYKRYAKEQPGTKARAYAQAEYLARAQHLGLWKDSDPTAPWDWRSGRRASSLLAEPQDAGGTIMLGILAIHAGVTP